MSFQGDHPHTMVWGGSNAFRRETLEKAKILQRWEQATIEDLNTTLAMQDVKQKVHFVPDCVAVTRTRQSYMAPDPRIYKSADDHDFSHGTLGAVVSELLLYAYRRVSVCSALSRSYFTRKSYYRLSLSLFWRHSVIAFFLKIYRAGSKTCQRSGTQLVYLPTSPQSGYSLAGLNAIYAVFQRKITWGWRAL